MEKCGLGLANCKMFETNNLRCFAQPRAQLDSPFPSVYVPFADTAYMPMLVWVLGRFFKTAVILKDTACVASECEGWSGAGEEMGI